MCGLNWQSSCCSLWHQSARRESSWCICQLRSQRGREGPLLLQQRRTVRAPCCNTMRTDIPWEITTTESHHREDEDISSSSTSKLSSRTSCERGMHARVLTFPEGVRPAFTHMDGSAWRATHATSNVGWCECSVRPPSCSSSILISYYNTA